MYSKCYYWVTQTTQFPSGIEASPWLVITLGAKFPAMGFFFLQWRTCACVYVHARAWACSHACVLQTEQVCRCKLSACWGTACTGATSDETLFVAFLLTPWLSHQDGGQALWGLTNMAATCSALWCLISSGSSASENVQSSEGNATTR